MPAAAVPTVTVPTIAVLSSTRQDAPPQLELLADRVDWRVTDADGLADALRGAEGLLLWDFFSSELQAAWPYADSLRWIHIAAAGVDRLLFPGLRDSAVQITNARGVYDRPIAEFVLASVSAYAKGLHESRDLQRAHTWRHRETRSVAGSRAMIVGTGAIGREVARLLVAVGVAVTGAGRVARGDDPDFGTVVASDRLAEHVADVDHLVVVAPLTDATRGLIGAEVLAALPPHAHLVNVGRGATVEESALITALQQGRLGGASLDVFETEPLPEDSPLWDLPGVAISAHMAGDVHGWQDALADQFVANARRWLDGEPLHNVIDKQRGYVPTSPA